MQSLIGWLTGHEQLLSALAALVVIGGVILSPLGRGLRALVARQRIPLVEGSATAAPAMVTDRPSIAVLPFTNMSDDREQEFLADGMTEDIITGLSLSRGLFVIARNSTFSYKGKSPNIRDVGRELGVRNVLEGSVRRLGESLRVTAQLIDARTGAHLWAQAFDRPLADIFKLQDEITAGIVAALTSHLTHAVAQDVARARPENLEAWELALRARAHFVANTDAAGQQTAEAMLRAAVKKDPTYAMAWAWLGATISSRRFIQPGSDSAERREEARAGVERGFALAPNDPDVLSYRGVFLVFTGKPEEAVPYFERATRLNPNEATYRGGLARALCYSGRPAEALAEMEAVHRLSPRDPFAPMYDNDMTSIQLALGRYAEAETWARRAIAGGQRNVLARINLGLALAAQGRVEEGREAVREAVRDAPQFTLAFVESAYRDLGFEESYLACCVKHLAIAWPPELKGG